MVANRRSVGLAVALSFAFVTAVASIATARAAMPASPEKVPVTGQDGADDQQPVLAIDPHDASRVAIAYQSLQQHGEQRSCGLALSEDGGNHWTAALLYGQGARAVVPEGFAACWNPSVAYAGDGALYYAFQTSLQPSNPYSHVFVTKSTDGGITFDAPVPVDARSPAFPGQRAGGDWWPAIAVDRSRNRVYVTWSRFTPGLDSSSILLAMSNDGGHSFPAPETVSPPEELDVTGSRVSVGADGVAYVTWTDYTQWERGDLLHCGAVGCSPYGFTTAQMDQALTMFYADEGSRLDYTQGLGCEAFRTGDMTILNGRGLNRGGNCTLSAALQSARSSDGGRTWQERTPPASSVYLGCNVEYADELPPWPSGHVCDATHYSNYDHNVGSVAAGAQGGTVTATWWDTGGTDVSGTARISVATSSDGAATWHTTTPACLPADAAGDQQHRPALSIASNGRLDLVCYDLGASGQQETYWTYASTPGTAFSTPVRLSSAASDTRVGPSSDDGWPSFGDHLAVASTNQRVDAAWTEGSGGPEPHQSIVFVSLAAHADAVENRAVSGAPWIVIAAGTIGGVVVAVAGAVAVLRRRLGASRVSRDAR